MLKTLSLWLPCRKSFLLPQPQLCEDRGLPPYLSLQVPAAPAAPATHHTPAGFHRHDRHVFMLKYFLLSPPLFSGQALLILKIQLRRVFYLKRIRPHFQLSWWWIIISCLCFCSNELTFKILCWHVGFIAIIIQYFNKEFPLNITGVSVACLS